jgi:ribosomal protein S21
MASANVVVHLRDCKGDQVRLVKRFIKKCKKEKVIERFLDKRFYEKPSTKRRRANLKKKRNAQKAEALRNPQTGER